MPKNYEAKHDASTKAVTEDRSVSAGGRVFKFAKDRTKSDAKSK